MRRIVVSLCVAASLLVAACTPGSQPGQPAKSGGGQVVFLSSQFKPIEEADWNAHVLAVPQE